jgi:Mg-chelatase subunit ChlD
MQPAGNTNVTIGLAWAWQTLTSGAPFPAPAEDPKYKYQKVIILLTDGENTQNRFSTSQSSIDARTKKACENAKAADITLYTVLVMQGTQSLLQSCASDSSKYFYLTSASQLVTAFSTIGTALSNLRISK